MPRNRSVKNRGGIFLSWRHWSHWSHGTALWLCAFRLPGSLQAAGAIHANGWHEITQMSQLKAAALVPKRYTIQRLQAQYKTDP